eukprot:TRINITY_DN5760_c0_g1_i2.p1 TRINITY_DN5760_c0_g1~~TRINITY_DN5760_c0_g1_i2.p1  ORF type:complete len:720 (-),score=211.19 TRINITY_DN5760_c0_g1_i2:39-2117(-)
MTKEDENEDLEKKSKRRQSVGFNKRKSILGPSNNEETESMELNDDEAERRERRKSRGVSSKRAGVLLEEAKQALDERKRLLSNDQLSELYSSCIKLSTENKINEKNTWELNLIDYIDDVLVAKQREENTVNANFQAAGSTLDAMSKIYSTRVDSVYSNIYKVLGGLNRTERGEDVENELKEGESKDENGEKTEETNEKDQLEKKKGKKSQSGGINTLDSWENITLKKFELEFDVDPLFKKTSATFDEAGAKGLLLNHLSVYNNCQIIFDSGDAVIDSFENVLNEGQTNQCDITELQRKIMSNLPDEFKNLQICPTFSNFTFSRGKKQEKEDNEDEFGIFGGLEDINIPDAIDYNDYVDDDDEEGKQQDARLEQMLEVAGLEEIEGETTFGGLDERVQIHDEDDDNVENEFSFVDPKMMSNWAGPGHWKFKNSKRDNKGSENAGENKEKKKTKKKEAFFLNFEDFEEPDESLFEPSKASIQIAKSKNKTANLLPPDIRYDIKSLTQLFCKPDCRISIAKKRNIALQQRSDEGMENETTDDYFHDVPNPIEEDDFSPVNDFNVINEDQNEKNQIDLSEFDDPNFGGLVPEPKKVEQIKVNYATSAKLVDIKALKDTLWQNLSDNNPGSSREEGLDVSFSGLLEELPFNKESNVSVPFAFICLLHLANEKGFEITQTKNNLNELQIELQKQKNKK